MADGLFGWSPDAPAMTPKERKRRKEPVPSGHASKPGTGPAGETCGSCKHIFRNVLAKTYLKCGLNRAMWTGGRKSDIRARDAACLKWAAADAVHEPEER